MTITSKSLFHEKRQAWKVTEATYENMEDAIDEWEAKLEFLEEHGKYDMEEEDRIHGLLEIVPTDLRVKLLEEQERAILKSTATSAKQIFYRLETQNENKRGQRINQIEEHDAEHEVQQEYRE